MLPNWTPFTRRDLSSLIDELAVLADSADTGVYGFGVEFVIESPQLWWWQRMMRRRRRDQARIAVTDSHGHAGYPVHIRLYTTHGAAATRKIDRRPGWTTSNTHGQAVLMMKARAAANGGYDAGELATGTVSALTDLHVREPKRGWRFRVDRNIVRA